MDNGHIPPATKDIRKRIGIFQGAILDVVTYQWWAGETEGMTLKMIQDAVLETL